MFQKVLIANRGEIAVRIIQACRDLGHHFGRGLFRGRPRGAPCADRGRGGVHRSGTRGGKLSEHGQHHLGGACVRLSGDPSRASASCPKIRILPSGPRRPALRFIGPTAATIRLMGDKSEAKRNAIAAGVPVALGTDGPLRDFDEAISEAERIGYPVMLKAASGGGGKGIRVAHQRARISRTPTTAQRLRRSRTSATAVCIWKNTSTIRATSRCRSWATVCGNVVHLFERECSVQRRHQKLIEESPSAFVTPELREKMTERGGRRSPSASATAARARSNFWSTTTAISISAR